jgi:thioredoxin reductase (NADPH)
MEKLVIIGSGMAGLTAAIYAARANLNPIVISGKEEGGQLMTTNKIENFPGFPEGINGPELVSKCKEQAKKFGTRFKDGDVTEFSIKEGNTYRLIIDREEKIDTRSIIIATGASPKKLCIESEKTYFNRGIHTCATCDGYFYSGKDIIVVGGGDSACEEALFLSNMANSIKMVVRKGELKASKIMQERIFSNKKISVIWNSAVDEAIGDGKKLTRVRIKNLKDGKISEIDIAGIFIAIGHIPNSKPFNKIVAADEDGYILIDEHMKTNLPGVFAAGDVCDKHYKQAITAAGAGTKAEIEAERYLSIV